MAYYFLIYLKAAIFSSALDLKMKQRAGSLQRTLCMD